MAQRHGKNSTDKDLSQIRDALSAYTKLHPDAKVKVRRQNSVSIRIRIIDPEFRGKDRVDRDDEVWEILGQLPEDVQTQITFLLLLTPDETETSLANFDFEHPIPSKL